MKYYPTLKLWKGGQYDSCVLNPRTLKGTSHGWYIVTKRIKGKAVLNVFPYSNSTIKHRKDIVAALGPTFVFDLIVEAPNGLQDLPAAIEHYRNRIKELEAEMVAKGARHVVNGKRKLQIAEFQQKIKELSELIETKQRKAG